MVTKKLPSGKELQMTMSDFEVSLALFEAAAKELDGIKIPSKTDVVEVVKSILMRGIYSQEIKAALRPCFDRCMYDKQKITMKLFEEEQARGDYVTVVKEVMVYNLTPFFSSLYSMFTDIQSLIPQGPPAQ